MATEISNNLIVLGGVVHNARGWAVSENATAGGTPVAVNLICQGVGSDATSSLESLPDLFQKLVHADELIDAVNGATVNQIPHAKYFDNFDRGFFAVYATHEEHTDLFYGIREKVSSSNYTTARRQSGDLTAAFRCDDSFVTKAGVRGSLEPYPGKSCGPLMFEKGKRLAMLSIPFL